MGLTLCPTTASLSDHSHRWITHLLTWKALTLQTHPSLTLPPSFFFSTSRTSLSTITLTLLNVLGLGAARRLKNAALGTLHRAQERAGSALHKTGPGISRQPPSSTTKHSSRNTVHRLRRTQYSTKPYLQGTAHRDCKTQELPRIELIVCTLCNL